MATNLGFIVGPLGGTALVTSLGTELSVALFGFLQIASGVLLCRMARVPSSSASAAAVESASA